jgi:class 3 adenylate cyclase
MNDDPAAPATANDNKPWRNRRLAAVVGADIAGYSRLMGEDEAATVTALKGHQAVVLPLVERYGGHVSPPPATACWPNSRACCRRLRARV